MLKRSRDARQSRIAGFGICAALSWE